jgi:hypothetical protein
MATGAEVMKYLRPNHGWAIYGDDFNSIIYDEGVTPLTKKEFDDTLKNIDTILLSEAQAKETQRQAILTRLGLSAEEAALLLS